MAAIFALLSAGYRQLQEQVMKAKIQQFANSFDPQDLMLTGACVVASLAAVLICVFTK